MNAKILPFTRNKHDREVQRHAYLIQELADVEQEISELTAKRERILRALGRKGLA